MASGHDAFDSASTQALTAYSSAWTITTPGGTAGSFNVNGSGELVPTATSGGDFAAFRNDLTVGADQFAAMRLTALAANHWIGPACRVASGVTFYQFYADSSTWYVGRNNGGVWTSLGSGSRTNAVGDVLRLEVSGTGATVTLRIYINGTQLGSDILDTAAGRITAAGAVGVVAYGTAGTTRGDGWVGGDLGSPALITRTVGSGSRQHASHTAWATWLAANFPNLVALNAIARAELYADSEFTSTGPMTFSGMTCDSTRYVEMVAASGQSFNDNASKLTNALRYNSANGVAIRHTGNYAYFFDDTGTTNFKIVFKGLQIKLDAQLSTNVGAVTLDRCVLEGGAAYIIGGSLSVPMIAINSVIRATNASGAIASGNATGNLFIGCTLIGAGGANAFNFGNYASGNIVRNSIVVGFAAIGPSARFTTASCTNNATDLASFGFGSGHVTSITASATFQNIGAGTEDYRIKAGAAVIGAGIRDQSYTADLDILGQARSTSTPTIGAFEYVVTGTPGLVQADAFQADAFETVAAGGGAAALDGASTASISSSGSLTTAIRLVGSSTASVTAAGTLTTQIRLTGSPTASVTSSGSLATAIQLAGSPSASIVSSGSLNTAIRLTASPAVSIAAAGALTGLAAAFDAAATASITAAGTLTTAIRLGGSSTASLTTSASLLTAIQLSGTPTASVTSSGVLATAIRLAASPTLSITTTASLTAGSSMDATVSASITASAQLTVGARLQAASSASVTATASLTVAARFVAAATGSVNAAGSLNTAIRLSGASAISAQAGGQLATGGSTMGASAAVSVVAAGNLTVQVLLTGTALAQAQATGQLTTGIRFAGSATVSVVSAGQLRIAVRFSGNAALAALGYAEQLGTALRQAQSIEDIQLRATVVEATLAAFASQPVIDAYARDIEMTVTVVSPQLDE